MDGLLDLDTHFKRFIRAEDCYRYNKLGVLQNETSLDRNVLIKDTALSTRLKNTLAKYNVITIGDIEDVTGCDMMRMKGLGE